MTRVKVWPTVSVDVRKAAEQTAGTNLKQGHDKTPKKVNDVLAGWLSDVVALRGEKDTAKVLAIVERLRGKPLTLPAVTP